MSARTEPPFRADHVGSLLRPPQLLQAREDRAAGRIDADELRAVEDEAIARDRPQAGGDRPALGDRRRVPPRVVAHGLHLPARRDHEGSRPHQRQVPQARRRHRVHAGGPARRREARRLADDLRRRVRVPARDGDAERPEADDPVAEHGPLPRRQGRDRRVRLPDPRRVLARSRRRLPRGGAAARRARLHLPPVRRHEPRVHERPAPARVHRLDRRRPRAPARRVHPPHQRGARRSARRGCA